MSEGGSLPLASRSHRRFGGSWWPALLVAVGGLGVLWLRFNARPGAFGADAWRMTARSDLVSYYLPMAEHAARRLSAGELPLWNPDACSGIPLLATLQVGVFYPGNWLAFALPARAAIPWLVFIECALGAFLAARLFRAWGYSDLPCALGGVLFLFGCVFGQILWPPVVACLVWWPWVLRCVHELMGGLPAMRRALWWCGLATGVALQLLAGFPQYLVYTSLAVAVALLVRALELRREEGALRLGARGVAVALAFALGAGIGGVQLLPSLELSSQSVRAAAMGAADLHYLTILDPYGSLDVVAGALDPRPGVVGFHLGNAGGYLGFAALVLSVLAFVARPSSPRLWIWLCASALALVLSDGLLGPGAPLYRAFAEIPLVGDFRTPERLRVVAFFGVVVLAVGGFDAVARAASGERPEWRPRLRVAAVAASVLFGAAMAGLGHLPSTWRALATAGLLWWILRDDADPGTSRRAQWALVAFVILDLTLATREVGALRGIPTEISARYTSADRSNPLSADAFESERDAVGSGRIELVRYRPRVGSEPSHGGHRISCYEPLVPAQWPKLERALLGSSGMGATLYDIDPEEQPLLYDLTAVERILRVDAQGEHEVIENPDAMPRARLYNRFRVEPFDRILGHWRRGDVDFRSEVLLERDPGLVGVGIPWPEALPARIVADEPERVVVEVDTPDPALLVLADSFYPGWTAEVHSRSAAEAHSRGAAEAESASGSEMPILRANGVHRAVVVEAGPQRVVFRYRPRSFERGALLSGASLLVLASVLAAGFWRGRTW